LRGARAARSTRLQKNENIFTRRSPPLSIGSEFLDKPFYSNGLRRNALLVVKQLRV
jgi:hypothetical protein